ncbi:hypothetical protein [Neisseria iguanae]|nr:hypothetical protein [Neisseria iguanae]
MSEENKIKVNDLPNQEAEAKKEVELPGSDNEQKHGGHREGGCCDVCGG